MISKKKEAHLALACAMAMILAAGSALASTRVGFAFTNLAPLDEGLEGVYEGWAVVDGVPVSTGAFNVNASGQTVAPGSGEIIPDFDTGVDLAEVTDIKVTLEPPADADPAPSGLIVLGGAVAGMTAMLTTGLDHVADATGAFILATPSDNPGMPDNNDMGIWFLTAPGPEPGFMNLPDLGSAWVYEGWVVDLSGPNPVPYSTGTFTQATGADSDMAGPMGGGPPFPGQDFVAFQGGPVLDLDTGTFATVISIEPVPDNSPAPFQFKPFAGMIPTNALGMNNQVANQTATTFPCGVANLITPVASENATWGRIKASYR